MLRDDRMMGMLTFVVILLAFGTLVQRFDGVQRLIGWGVAPVELAADEATARPGEIVVIDVLANDAGVGPGDGDRLTIVARPDCGRAFVRNGQVNYLGDSRCAGVQRFAYGLAGDGATGEVRVRVAAGEPTTQAPPPEDNRVAAAPPDPAPSSAAVEPPPAPAGLSAPAPAPGAPNGAGMPTPAAGPGDGGTGVGGAEAATGSRTGPGEGAGDTSQPAAAPEGGSRDAARDSAGDVAGDVAGDAAGTPEGAAPGAGGGTETADRRDAECTLPPALTLEAGPGAMTGVSIDSPCHAGEVAELAYDGLRFAIALDARGAGSLAVPGFQRASQAELTLGGDDPLAFEIAFRDVERIERVAVVWEAPAALALHALEFGARPGGDGHVRPDRPRSFEAVRRAGGGWLAGYAPAGEAGQRIDVYTYWRRYGGPSGVVKLGLEPAGGDGGAEGGANGGAEGDSDAGACGDGTTRAADYRVLRSAGGRPERERLGRVAPLDCTLLAGRAAPVLGDAVDDLIVRRR